MAKPTEESKKKIKRLTRYLINAPRVIVRYPWQGRVATMSGFSDSDWAGCQKTAKSTSGGVMLKGRHYIKSWSTTQKTIALSSGEAELVAIVKMSTELLGIIQLMNEWNHKVEAEVLADSTTALAVVNRKGNGKMRHVRIGKLWIQQKREDGELKYEKVLGTKNPADMMTKHIKAADIEVQLERMGMRTEEGRAREGLKL